MLAANGHPGVSDLGALTIAMKALGRHTLNTAGERRGEERRGEEAGGTDAAASECSMAVSKGAGCSRVAAPGRSEAAREGTGHLAATELLPPAAINIVHRISMRMEP